MSFKRQCLSDTCILSLSQAFLRSKLQATELQSICRVLLLCYCGGVSFFVFCCCCFCPRGRTEQFKLFFTDVNLQNN